MRKTESLLESKFNLNLIVCDLLIRDNLVSENNEMVGGGPWKCSGNPMAGDDEEGHPRRLVL